MRSWPSSFFFSSKTFATSFLFNKHNGFIKAYYFNATVVKIIIVPDMFLHSIFDSCDSVLLFKDGRVYCTSMALTFLFQCFFKRFDQLHETFCRYTYSPFFLHDKASYSTFLRSTFYQTYSISYFYGMSSPSFLII